MSTMESVLTTTPVAKLIEGQNMVYALATDSLQSVAEKITSNDISSVPVFKNAKSQKINDCIGIVDYTDIAGVLIDLLAKGYTKHDPRRNIWQKFDDMQLKDAIKFNASKYVQVNVNDKIIKVVENTAEFAFRRMLAVDVDERVVGVVSPSELCTVVLAAVDSKDEILTNTVGDLHVGNQGVISVKKNESVTKAYQKMAENMVSAVAVVDTKLGTLSANLSASDVRLIIENKSAEMLGATVWKFITDKKSKENDEVYPYFSVTPNSSLKSTTERMLATKVHHLYVVDDSNKPSRVIGFSDLFRGFLAFARK